MGIKNGNMLVEISGDSADSSGHVILGAEQLAVETRIARFDHADDMPADITVSGNVSANTWKNTTFTATASRVIAKWHQGVTRPSGNVSDNAPVATGAILTINADDDSNATTRLTYTDQTGGNTTTSGKTDVFMVSPDNPVVDVTINTTLTRIDAIGIPAGGGAAPTNAVPCFLTLEILG